MAEFALLHPASLAEIHEFDSLAPNVANFLVADPECLATTISFAKPTHHGNGH